MSSNFVKHILYAGPTLFNVDSSAISAAGYELRPPIKRRDLEILLKAEKQPGKLIIADGTFHAFPSVGHQEIMECIDLGWDITGVSSMGAIRAAEMSRYGMKGFGEVYRCFAQEGYDDDEVTLIHSEEAPFFPISISMVQIRKYIEWLTETHAISADIAMEILTSLKKRWYGERTLKELNKELERYSLLTVTNKDLLPFDAKALDLIALLKSEAKIGSSTVYESY